jgi:hypothetical protein
MAQRSSPGRGAAPVSTAAIVAPSTVSRTSLRHPSGVSAAAAWMTGIAFLWLAHACAACMVG